MKKVIKYPSTPNFINLSRSIKMRAEYVGDDVNGDPIYDSNMPKPIINFVGTVKLHGTNGSVVFSKGEIYFQSRDNILGHTDEGYKDNSNFEGLMSKKKYTFLGMFDEIAQTYLIDVKNNDIVIYGEWAGKGIMKRVGIGNVEKSFYIFGVKIKPHNEDESSYWIDHNLNLTSPNDNIYNIKTFPTFNIEIDFNKPGEYIEELDIITNNVEMECPVAKQLGHSGIGEGVVWSAFIDNTFIRFKVKGEKHSKASKQPKVKLEDPYENMKMEIADELTPGWRLEQGINEVCNLSNGGYIDMKNTGDYIKWVMNDVLKEEMLTIDTMQFSFKEILPFINQISKTYYINSFKEQLQ